MIKVILINQDKIPHYRIPIYNYLSAYLQKESYKLTIVSGGIQQGNRDNIEFEFKEIPLNFLRLANVIIKEEPKIVIFWTNFRNLYLFPTLLLTKMLRKKVVYWGHGSDLYGNKYLMIKNISYNIAFWLSDAIILYGDHLKKYIKSKFHNKIHVANNTLCFKYYVRRTVDKEKCLSNYDICTKKNIICIGRMQKRKRLQDLFAAFNLINRRDIGLILIGPDEDGILDEFHGANIYKIGPLYGEERLDLLSSAEVFCLPGPIGLSIVDALYCGLPVVTEDGKESPEIMYLENGINGFIVPKADVRQLAESLLLLLDDDALREKFSENARKEIYTNGHIDRMCEGFRDALRFVS